MNKFQELVNEWNIEGYELVDENLISFTNGGVFLGFHLDEVTVRRKEESSKKESYITNIEIELMKRTLSFLPSLFELREKAYILDVEATVGKDGSIELEEPKEILLKLVEEVNCGVGHVNY